MKNHCGSITIGVLIFVLLTAMFGFSQQLPLVNYGIHEGLPSIFIIWITQGSDGRIWIVHQTGISVYDGSEFTNWNSLKGLMGNTPDSLVLDKDGTAWVIFADRGIQYMEEPGDFRSIPDPDGKFERDRIPYIFALSDGTVLAAGGQGYYRIRKTGIQGPFYPGEGRNGRIFSIVDLGEENGTLFAADDGVFHLRAGRWERFALPYNEFQGAAVADIIQGNHGEIWMVTTDSHVIRWKNEKSRIWKLNIPEKVEFASFYNAGIDPYDNLWISSSSGLILFKDGESVCFTEEEGLSTRWINCVFVDSQGILWIGSEGGLSKISQMSFRNFSYRTDLPVNGVWTLAELPDGTIWAGTNSGIIEFGLDGEIRRITEKDGLPENVIIDMEVLPDGKVWILTYSGIHLWNKSRFISYPYALFREINLDSLFVYDENEVWIITEKGIFGLDVRSGKIAYHPINDRIRHIPFLNEIRRAKDGRIFMAGTELAIWDGQEIELLPIPDWDNSAEIFRVIEHESVLWLITSVGLLSFDGSDWKSFSLENTMIFDMVPVDRNEFWLGCSTGIARFDGKHFQFFSRYDGVAVEECSTGASLQDKRGRIWLGGKNIVRIEQGVFRNLPSTRPLVTWAQIGNQRLVLPEKLEFSSRIQNLEFHFSSTCYFNEQEQVYRYRIKGIDDIWSDPTRNPIVHFAGLPPGHYTFEIQARHKHGGWSGETASLPVEVVPTFWQTTAARILLVMTLVMLGFLVNAARIRNLQAQKNKLDQLVKKQTREIEKQRDMLAQLAATDDLTGLPNRRAFIEHLDREVDRAARYERNLSICIFDLDDFKSINDTYGHAVGDLVLRRISELILPVIRDSDTFARFGGDEFVYVMPETKKKEGAAACEKIRLIVKNASLQLKSGEKVDFSISGGLATLESGETGPRDKDELFKEADRALYFAKDRGRNRIIHSDDLPAEE